MSDSCKPVLNLQASLRRSLTIDVSGLRAGVLGPLPLPHSHSASVSYVATALEEEPAPAAAEELPQPSQACTSPFCSTTIDMRSAFLHPPSSTQTGQSVEEKQGMCSEPVSSQTPRDPDLFSSCSFSPYYSTLGSCISNAGLSCQEASILLPNCPPHGVKAVCGKRAKMEDAFTVQPNFFDMPASSQEHAENRLPARIAMQLEQLTDSLPPAHSSMHEITYETDTLHFFGVYDGHGGSEAAQHCATRLHYHLSQALGQACRPPAVDVPAPTPETNGNPAGCLGSSPAIASEAGPPAAAAAANGDHAMNDNVPASAPEPAPPSGSSDPAQSMQHVPSPPCNLQASHDSQLSSQSIEDTNLSEGSSGWSENNPFSRKSVDSISGLLQAALYDAFLRTDTEFASDGCAAMVGSTAVVALIGKHKMWIANCGDSRAVLCRSGKVIQLTDDHKPERADETARVEKAGGQVLYWNGHRVMGVLAMSRAIGDHGLRPYVIPEPEITVLTRCDDDDFLLLASDGLWDVMANQEATNLAIRCMHRAWEKGASRKAAVRIAASVLTKAAIDRGSKDNVTVVIVDLNSGLPPVAKAVPESTGDGQAQAREEGEQAPSAQPGSPTPATTDLPPGALGEANEAAAQQPCCEGCSPGT